MDLEKLIEIFRQLSNEVIEYIIIQAALRKTYRLSQSIGIVREIIGAR